MILVVLSITLSGCVQQSPPPVNYFTYVNNTLSYNGTLSVEKLQLENPHYDFLYFPASIIKTAGTSNIPDATTYGYAFSHTNEEQLFITSQIPNIRVPDSDVIPHFNWHTNDDSAGDVVWCIEYSWTNIGDVVQPPITECLVGSSQLDSDIIILTNNITINGTGKEGFSVFKSRIYRDVLDPRDTYNNDALFNQFDLRFKVNTFGVENQ